MSWTSLTGTWLSKTLAHFQINPCLDFEPYGGDNAKRGPGDLHGIVFENITVTAPSVLDEPDILWGMSDGLIYDFTFKNVMIGDKKVTGIDHFLHNEYVFDKKPEK